MSAEITKKVIEIISNQLEIEPDPAVDWSAVYEGTKLRPELRA